MVLSSCILDVDDKKSMGMSIVFAAVIDLLDIFKDSMYDLLEGRMLIWGDREHRTRMFVRCAIEMSKSFASNDCFLSGSFSQDH